MKKIFLVSVMVAFSLWTEAQNIKTSNITWSSSQLFNLITGEMKVESNTIISTGESSIEWKQPDGTVKTFTVSQAIGQWADIKNSGEIIYKVKNTEESGTVTFANASSGNTIRIQLLANTAAEPSIYELKVASYKLD